MDFLHSVAVPPVGAATCRPHFTAAPGCLPRVRTQPRPPSDEGGGCPKGRRKERKNQIILSPSLLLRKIQPPADGPVAALAVHRTAIHYRDCASLTLVRGGLGAVHSSGIGGDRRFRAATGRPYICALQASTFPKGSWDAASRKGVLWDGRPVPYRP